MASPQTQRQKCIAYLPSVPVRNDAATQTEMRSVSARYTMFWFFASQKYFAARQLGVPCYRHLICDHMETFYFSSFLSETRLISAQHHVQNYGSHSHTQKRYEITFSGGDLLWGSELPSQVTIGRFNGAFWSFL